MIRPRGHDLGRLKWETTSRIAVVGGSLLLAMGLYSGAIGAAWVQSIAEWMAVWTGFGLGLLGIATSVDGAILASDGFAVNIVTECTAIGPLVVFAGAVLAYPSPFRAKGWGILLGIAVISAVNLARMVSLFWIGSSYPQYMSVAHLLVWQAAIIILAITLWLFWAERAAMLGTSSLLTFAFRALILIIIVSSLWAGVAAYYNGLLVALAVPFTPDSLTMRVLGTHILIESPGLASPMSVDGLNLHWGLILVTVLVLAAFGMGLARRLRWLLALAAASLLTHVLGLVLLAHGVAWASGTASPGDSGRLVFSGLAVFWGLLPILIGGVWCVTCWLSIARGRDRTGDRNWCIIGGERAKLCGHSETTKDGR